MRGLIGYTGFVGSNLLTKTTFDKQYNSKNINEIKGERFSSLVCAGASAVKWMANKYPSEDWTSIQHLMVNLKEVECKDFVLISTVDVYNTIENVNENTKINIDELAPYGRHRYMLEEFVKQHFPKVTIIRLPGLFGIGLKKNIIFDFIHNNCIELINSKNIFQFYYLDRLNSDIEAILANNIQLINLATEPLSVKEVAKHAFDLEFNQVTDVPPVHYNMKSVHSSIFTGSSNGYISTKDEVLEEIKRFVECEQYQGCDSK